MSIKITRTGLEQAIVAEEPRPPAMLPGEYAGRLWLRLNGTDLDNAPACTSEQSDVRAPARETMLRDAAVLAQAREIMLQRFPGGELGTTELFADTLAHWVKRLKKGW